MRQDIAQSIYSPLRITNSHDQRIGDKFQFFSDALALICHKSGEFSPYEVDNHISLLRHLLFIADSTLERPNRTKDCVKQIKYVLQSHPLFSSNDTVLNEDIERKKSINAWLKKIQSEILKKDGVDNLKKIRNYMNEILKIMEPDYLEFVVKAIYTKFGCRHTLNYHKRDFESLARIIFSWYYLRGRSRQLISRFTIKALSKEITIQGNAIYPETYLPKGLYDRLVAHNKSPSKSNKSLHKEIVTYVKKRGTKGQARSFEYVSHYQPHRYRLFFLLEGLLIFANDDNDEIDVLGLKIRGIEAFKKTFADYDFESFTRGFFSDENHSAVVEIEVDAYTVEDAAYVGIEELTKRLGKIMRRANCRFSINRKHYAIITGENEKEFWTNTMPEIGKVSNHDAYSINLREQQLSESPHKNFYLELDYILQQGFLEDNITTSIHFYRKYLDILFNGVDDCEIKHDEATGVPKEILCLAYLLLYTEKKKFQDHVQLWTHNRIINSVFFSDDELGRSYRDKVRSTNTLPSFAQLLKHISPTQEHTKYETTRAMNYSSRFKKRPSFDFYVRQLLFIKQYRDKHEHVNIIDDTVARKLGLYSYRIINQLHWDIFKILNQKSNAGKSHGQILKEAILTARASMEN